jgi:hypothetical protein
VTGLPCDMLQFVDCYRFPGQLVHSECTYRFSNRYLTDLYESTERLHPMLIEMVQSFDLKDLEDL